MTIQTTSGPTAVDPSQIAAPSFLLNDAPSRRRGAEIYATWLFWIGAVAIAVASTLTIMNLLDHADTRRRTQLVLADLNLMASRLRLAELRTHFDPAARPSLASPTSGVAAELSGAIDQLLSMDPDGDAADRVREAVEQYRSNVEKHLELLRSDDRATAWQWEQERSGPSYELLQEATAQSGIFYSAQATRSLRRVRTSAALAIGSEALLIAFLGGISARARRRAERHLHEERDRHAARFQALVQHSADAIALLDARGVIRYLSPSSERILGYPVPEALGMNSLSFLAKDAQETARAALREVIEGGVELKGLELSARHAEGSVVWIEVSARNLLEDPNVGGVVLNFRDVTRGRELKDQLRHQALHDPLTDLANRELFGQWIEKALARARRERTPLSLMYIDLDGFKAVNDTLGHEAGDELLIGVTARLKTTIRESEMAARLGGDEFAILLDGVGRDGAIRVAERILRELETPFQVTAGEASVGASIGIAVGTPDLQNPDELLRQADVAMYLAKGRGKGRCEVFQPGMPVLAMRTARQPADLERALNRDELFLQYQPVIHLETGRLVAVEALVRWRVPGSGKVLPPSDFLPMAEESGLILPLGRWVLREGCRQVRRWQTEYPSQPPLLLSLNLSARQFASPELPADVLSALRDSGLAPTSLVLEIAEEVLTQLQCDTLPRLEALRRLGVLLAIDDFGSGSSCVESLNGFTVDLVKIEKRFIDHITVAGAGSKLALQIIEKARRLSQNTLAEGVEEEAQIAEVAAAGCDLAQDFSLARPLDPLDLERLLRSPIDVRPSRQSTERAAAVSA